jgi:hypothetical protein
MKGDRTNTITTVGEQAIEGDEKVPNWTPQPPPPRLPGRWYRRVCDDSTVIREKVE